MNKATHDAALKEGEIIHAINVLEDAGYGIIHPEVDCTQCAHYDPVDLCMMCNNVSGCDEYKEDVPQ